MRRISLFLFASFLILAGCQRDKADDTLDIELDNALSRAADNGDPSFFRLPSENELASIPADPRNPLSPQKVALGKFLFHETALAQNPLREVGRGTYSCASCHFAAAGFQAGRFQGMGEGGIGFGINGESRQRGPMYSEEDVDVQPVRSPSAMNLAYQPNILWNGQFGATHLNEGTEYAWGAGTPKEKNHLGYEGLETQAIAGMDVHRLNVDRDLVAGLGYKAMFDAAFPDFNEADRYNTVTAGLAIAAYERTLLSAQAPFQKWLRGDRNAMTSAEKRGAILFFDEAGCVDCHTGPALSEMAFYGYGMDDLFSCPEPVLKTNPNQTDHLGRGGFTQRAEDNYKFKVPQLYNLISSPFYGHGSSFRSIRDVVEYKNRGVKQNSQVPDEQLAEQFRPLGLSQSEIDDLTEFLENALFDPNLDRFQPESVLSGNCFPNNDPMSRNQLGCE